MINPELGSWLFLSEIICSLPLEPDAPGARSVRHVHAVPGRLSNWCAGRAVRARLQRCLSYLTIELKGPIPASHRDDIGAHAYGCDICQEVCPWNLAPAVSSGDAWQPRSGLDTPRLLELWRQSDDELRRLIKGSAMTRAGVKRLRRNLATAIGNCGEADAAVSLESHESPAGVDPLVAEHVQWAVGKLRGGRGEET